MKGERTRFVIGKVVRGEGVVDEVLRHVSIGRQHGAGNCGIGHMHRMDATSIEAILSRKCRRPALIIKVMDVGGLVLVGGDPLSTRPYNGD